MKSRRGGRARETGAGGPAAGEGAAPGASIPQPGAWNPPAGGFELLALVLIVAAALWIQAGALRAPFFADDYLFLDQARHRSLIGTLLSPDPIGNYLRPVSRQVWFWTLGRLGGESPLIFHAANLLLLAGILVLLHHLVRRALGPWPALASTAWLAVHHAFDVPALWASGSQDLLAVLAALGSIALAVAGRPVLAAVVFAAGLLSKETVVFTPVLAALLARRPGETLRATGLRHWPLFATLGLWAATWTLTISRRPAIGLEVRPEGGGVPGAFVHLLQTAIGLEWPHAGLAGWLHAAPSAGLLLALAALAVFLWRGAGRGTPSVDRGRHALVVGATWAALGALPVIAVAPIWSAYYYLFALTGLAFVVGALVARLPAAAAIAVIGLLGLGAAQARALPEFATRRGVWTAQSHLNQRYLLRGMHAADRFLGDLRRARPTLPAASTIFFAGVPAQVAFQAADGPLLRWAYRDSSLRGRFLAAFRVEHADRGPLFFFQVRDDTLEEITGADSLERVGFGQILSETYDAAADMHLLEWRRARNPGVAYQLAWVELARGRPAETTVWLERGLFTPDPGPAPEVVEALDRVAAGDTLEARRLADLAVTRHALDPGAHALRADLLLLTPGTFNAGVIEALAARLLAPDNASTWRRWGMVLMMERRDQGAAQALERYFELGGESAAADAQAREILEALQRRLPGGDLAQHELRRPPGARRP